MLLIICYNHITVKKVFLNEFQGNSKEKLVIRLKKNFQSLTICCHKFLVWFEESLFPLSFNFCL